MQEAVRRRCLRGRVAYLHCHYSVVYCDLFGEEVGPNCCFVACAELFVDLRYVM